ncbi:hypothetical protein ABPG72_008494 [Tetrahymena utriculariae]
MTQNFIFNQVSNTFITICIQQAYQAKKKLSDREKVTQKVINYILENISQFKVRDGGSSDILDRIQTSISIEFQIKNVSVFELEISEKIQSSPINNRQSLDHSLIQNQNHIKKVKLQKMFFLYKKHWMLILSKTLNTIDKKMKLLFSQTKNQEAKTQIVEILGSLWIQSICSYQQQTIETNDIFEEEEEFLNQRQIVLNQEEGRKQFIELKYQQETSLKQSKTKENRSIKEQLLLENQKNRQKKQLGLEKDIQQQYVYITSSINANLSLSQLSYKQGMFYNNQYKNLKVSRLKDNLLLNSSLNNNYLELSQVEVLNQINYDILKIQSQSQFNISSYYIKYNSSYKQIIHQNDNKIQVISNEIRSFENILNLKQQNYFDFVLNRSQLPQQSALRIIQFRDQQTVIKQNIESLNDQKKYQSQKYSQQHKSFKNQIYFGHQNQKALFVKHSNNNSYSHKLLYGKLQVQGYQNFDNTQLIFNILNKKDIKKLQEDFSKNAQSSQKKNKFIDEFKQKYEKYVTKNKDSEGVDEDHLRNTIKDTLSRYRNNLVQLKIRNEETNSLQEDIDLINNKLKKILVNMSNLRERYPCLDLYQHIEYLICLNPERKGIDEINKSVWIQVTEKIVQFVKFGAGFVSIAGAKKNISNVSLSDLNQLINQ